MLVIVCVHCGEEIRLYTTEDAAEILDRPLRNVQWATKKHNIGIHLGRDWVLTERDLELLRSLPGPGRPKRKVRRPFKVGDEVRFRGYQKPPPGPLPRLAPGTIGRVKAVLDPRDGPRYIRVCITLPLVDASGKRWETHPEAVNPGDKLCYSFKPKELEQVDD